MMAQTADRAHRLREEIRDRIAEIRAYLEPRDAEELGTDDLRSAFTRINGAAHDAIECCDELERL